MTSLPLLLLLQAAAPTVGDTIWVARTARVPAGHEARAPDWQPGDPLQLLGPARVVRRGNAVELRFPLVAWAPGEHRVSVPGPVLIAPDGTVDSLPGESHAIAVASVLPPVPDSELAPQPAATTIPRTTWTLAPLGILVGVAAALLVPLHLRWRRRGPPLRIEPPPAPGTESVPVDRWIAAGET
ncbi:MAG TPA: hypothetical protein VNK43_05850, partial [Gemmatimonadales bacterium]|nr:hypothetical protein [Gemmatimonadales bacterium]